MNTENDSTAEKILNPGQVFSGYGIPTGRKMPQGFRLADEFNDKNGTVLQFSTKQDGVDEWQPMSAPIVPLGLARNESGDDWCHVVLFVNRDGHIKQYRFGADALVAASDFPTELMKELVRAGLWIAHDRKAKKKFFQYLCHTTTKRYTTTTRTGWHQNDFVTAQQTFGDQNYLLTEQAPLSPPAGSLTDWKQDISSHAVGNSRLVFAISLALTSPTLRFTNQASGGFHLVGTSSQGKSVAAKVGESVWSVQLPSWNATKNGIENLAATRSDIGLFLDEIGEADRNALAEMIYMLGNGSGKARSTTTGENRVLKSWTLFWLSTGESSLNELVKLTGKNTHAGQEIRIVDIEADAGTGFGLFTKVPNGIDAAAFADQLKNATNSQCGTAGPAFIEYLVANHKTAKASLKNYIDAFTKKNIEPSYSGQVKRVASRFAQVAAAGELATVAGVTGWNEGEAMKAASICFRSWLTLWKATTVSKESQRAIEQVASFITQNEARFDPLACGLNSTTQTQNRAGYSKDGNTDPNCRYWLILPKVFNEEVCKGMRPATVKKALDDINQIERDSEGKYSIPYTPQSTGSKQRFVVVYDTVKSMAGES